MTTLFSNFWYRPSEDGSVTVVYLDSARQLSSGTLEDGDLHAYVDAALNVGRRSDVEAKLARDPAARAAACAYRDLNVDLHRLFDRVLPPLTLPLEALSCELERRLASRSAISSLPYGAVRGAAAFVRAVGRSVMRLIRWFAGNPWRGADATLVLGRTAAAIDRSPLSAVAVVAGVIVAAGVGWPMLAGEPASCADRVEAAAKQVAKARSSPELAERLASVGFMCRVGETERADQLLARLDEEVRQPRH